MIRFIVVIVLLCQTSKVTGYYTCLCNYNVEEHVYSQPSTDSQTIGYMYEFDCKPLYYTNTVYTKFQPIQFEHKVKDTKIGYVELHDGSTPLQTCQGDPPASDIGIMTTMTTGHFVDTSHIQTHKPTYLTTTTTTTTITPTPTTPPASTTTTTTSTTTTPTSTPTTTPTTTAKTTTPTTTTATTTTPTTTPTTTTTTTTTTPVPVTLKAACPSGWEQHQDSCYLFKTEHHWEWEPADNYCRDKQSHLVIIETADEDHYLAETLKNRIDTDRHHDSDSGTWVGATDNDSEGTWIWRDSFHHKDSPVQGYTNWHHGEPDAGDGGHDEDCMCLIGNKHFEWQDYRCRDNMYFVCEKSLYDSPVLVG